MINTCFTVIRLLPFCNFNVPCDEGHGRPLLALYLFSLDLCIFHLITRGLLRPFWPDWLLCIIFMFRFNWCSCNTFGSLFYWLCYLPSLIKFSEYYVFLAFILQLFLLFSVSAGSVEQGTAARPILCDWWLP